MPDQQETVERRGREGGRWINERPSSEEFGAWFASNMKIDEKLKAEDYLGGVVLIPAVDTRSKHVTGFHNGEPVIEERPELAFIPYAKVETRVAYYWDLLAAHEEWVGVVERITPPRMPVVDVDPVEEHIEEPVAPESTLMRTVSRTTPGKPGGLATMVHQLPEGFSIMSVPVTDGYSHFLCCTTRVAIYDRAEYKEDPEAAVPLRQGQGTKQVPLLGSYQQRVWADNSSLMKAETGALGRALGFAGIFVIPGSGVATAEDMIEAMTQGDAPTSGPAAPAETNQGPAAPEAPARTGAEQAEDEETQLRQRANALWKELKESYPDAAQNKFGPWAAERRLTSVADAKGAMLKGLVKKLEKLLDEAKTATAEREGGDVPAEAPETTSEPGGEEATGDGDEPSGQAG